LILLPLPISPSPTSDCVYTTFSPTSGTNDSSPPHSHTSFPLPFSILHSTFHQLTSHFISYCLFVFHRRIESIRYGTIQFNPISILVLNMFYSLSLSLHLCRVQNYAQYSGIPFLTPFYSYVCVWYRLLVITRTSKRDQLQQYENIPGLV
jgi:hypothetical protein